MDEFFTKITGTLIGRPYVFLFFAAYLFVCTQQMGLNRALWFIPAGYGIAFASEKLSITTGIPYGWYFYEYANLQQDWLVAGVPFFDSLSYVFLSYVGWSMAITLTTPLNRRSTLDVRWSGDPARRRHWPLILFGGALTMLLDVVIDPIAHEGDEWFLGKIYGYGQAGAEIEGEYFEVSLTNFVGWFVTSSLIVAAYAGIDGWLSRRTLGPIRHGDSGFASGLLGAGLFYGVLVFNLGVTLAVALQRHLGGNAEGAFTMLMLFLCGVAWHAPFAVWLWRRLERLERR